jgi:hypothetical protein
MFSYVDMATIIYLCYVQIIGSEVFFPVTEKLLSAKALQCESKKRQPLASISSVKIRAHDVEYCNKTCCFKDL